ncbi:MAG TPA: FlgD immunoglobulin-like domain containing protein [Gaiellaceae bacterium]|jgi:flagellar hook assembly protein FlgD
MSGLVHVVARRFALLRGTLVVTAAALAMPALASAGVRIESRDVVPVTARSATSARPLAPRAAPFRFDMVGIHWLGSGSVRFRTARIGGVWSAWHAARPEGEDRPDAGSTEAQAEKGWKLGNPFWTGPAGRIQYRTTGDVRRIRAFFLWSPVTRTARASSARTVQPAVISRKAWGANEKIVRAKPEYADRLAFSVVHHTAGAQPTSKAQSAAIVRGIQTYHVQGNGWNDIGYNFLVDRFGEIFEGRGGGIARNVVGAHAMGFNTGSVGVAVIGTYTSSSITAAARNALVRLIAWRLDLAHVDPISKLNWRSGGNPRFAAGKVVRIRTVSGHRDTGYTSCPGNALYADLNGIAASIRARGLPKIYNPRAIGTLGGPVRFRAVVDPAKGWTVTVTDESDAVVASGSGTGTTVDWTWDSSNAPEQNYRWTISAGQARPGTGLIGPAPAPPPLALRSVSVTPTVVSPNGDGFNDTAALAFRVSAPAQVRVRIRVPSGGEVATAYPWTSVSAGSHKVTWNGRALTGDAIPDGDYVLRFEAERGAEDLTEDVPVVVDTTLAALAAKPKSFSPNGDGRADSTRLSFRIARAANVEVRIVKGDRRLAILHAGTLSAGAQTFTWNGRLSGKRAADGSYSAVVVATTTLGKRRLVRPLLLDTVRPRVTDLRAERVHHRTQVRFTLSEPGRVWIWFGGRFLSMYTRKSGRLTVARYVKADRVRIRSFDAAGNRSRIKSARVGA